MRPYFFQITLSSFLCSSLGQADPVFDLSLEEVLQLEIYSVSRHEEKLIDVPATVYIVDEQTIRQQGYRDLKDVLKNVPGVEYAYPHSWLQGGQRGFTGNWSKTKLMIDGIEVNLLYSGESFIGHQFMMDNVKRVEIIQGPGSVLYGADAYSGIINIVTKNANNSGETSNLRLRMEDGTRNYGGHHTSISSTQKFNHWDVSIFAASLDLDDADYSDFVSTTEFSEPEPNHTARRNFIESGQEPYRDTNRAIHFDLTSNIYFSDVQKLNIKLLYLKDRDGGGLESPDISMQNFKTVRDQRLFHIDYFQALPDQGLSFRFKFDHHDSDEYNDLNFRELVDGELSEIYIFDIVDSKENIAELQVDINPPSSSHYTILGVGYRKKELPLPDFELKAPPQTSVTDFASLVPFQEQSMKYIFAQTKLNYFDGRLKITLGARKDEHNIYDAPVTLRSGLGYHMNKDFVIKLNYGESFRSPTMFELETNSNLGPAKLKSYELALIYSQKHWTSNTSIYQLDADDLIVTLFDSSMTENFTSVNEGKTDVKGVESSITTMTDHLDFNVWINWTDVSVQENIAEWKAGFTFAVKMSEHHDIGLNARYHGDTDTVYLDEDFNSQSLEVSSFYTIDFNWNFDNILDIKSLSGNFAVRNITNKRAIYPNVRGNDPKGFLVQGMNGSLGLKYQF